MSGLTVAAVVISLFVSLFTLYRSELRGPKITLDLLEVPTDWMITGWFYVGMVVYQLREGDTRPTANTAMRLQIAGNLKASLRNDGPRGGIFFGLSFDLVNTPTLFDFRAINKLPEEEPVPVKGKETRGFAPQLIFGVDQVEFPTIVRELQRSSDDLTLVASYTANRGLFGRRQKAETQINLSRTLITDAVTKWDRSLK